MSTNFLEAKLLSQEHVSLSALYTKEVTVPIFNTVSYNFLKDAISKAILDEENIKAIHLEMISKNISSYISTGTEENPKVIIDKAGPSLNMKILGPDGLILFDYASLPCFRFSLDAVADYGLVYNCVFS